MGLCLWPVLQLRNDRIPIHSSRTVLSPSSLSTGVVIDSAQRWLVLFSGESARHSAGLKARHMAKFSTQRGESFDDVGNGRDAIVSLFLLL